jgi:SAM-dependent MidA family methyltransferase
VEPIAGLRREPPTDLTEVGDDESLARRIREEIRRAGPMPFARFMWLCLYDPTAGYYVVDEGRPGRGGDFITAPELHPIFGATLSGLVLDAWERFGRPDAFTIREYGPGTGALAASLIGALAGTPLGDIVRYAPVEVEGRSLEAIRARLAAADLIDRLIDPVGAAATRPIAEVVIANEVLDALPVHRVRQRGSDLREIAVGVDADGAFLEIEIDPSTPALAGRLSDEEVALADGQTAEICLAVDDWVANAAAGLARGLLLLIDYGAPASALYDPARRRDGTLRAYVRHQVHDDPYRHVGRQDLTAHVDVTAIERAASRVGLSTIGVTTQAEALIGLGIEDRLRAIQADPATTIDEYLVVRSSLMRLLDPAAMGRFQVMGFGRDWPGPPPAAFTFRLPDRTRPPRNAPD